MELDAIHVYIFNFYPHGLLLWQHAHETLVACFPLKLQLRGTPDVSRFVIPKRVTHCGLILYVCPS